MANSKFWRKLAKKFRQLPDNDLYAEKTIDGLPGTIPPPGDYWQLTGSSVHIAMEFEALARIGGDNLSRNDSVDSFQAWMRTLYSYGLNIENRNLMQRLPGKELSNVVVQVENANQPPV